MEEKKEYINFSGSAKDFPVNADDRVSIKFAMLLEGESMGLGASKAAAKYGYTKQRYYQLLHAFQQEGIEALRSKKPGPKGNSVRTERVENQIIRHRFLDPKASEAVIAQKLNQMGYKVSKSSVERTIRKYGLQKKASFV